MCAKIRDKQYILNIIYAVSVPKAGGIGSTAGTGLPQRSFLHFLHSVVIQSTIQATGVIL